tara:strand:- start:25006 stop:25242 length:237 start_codon:yes stop_codon:yes gene_type:complete
MLAVSLVLGSFLLILSFIIGIVIGWVVREYMMNYREIPKLHPEFYDENGNVIPDEVYAVRFEEGFFDDDDDDEDEDDD